MDDVPGSSGGGGGGGGGDDPPIGSEAWIQEMLDADKFDPQAAWNVWEHAYDEWADALMEPMPYQHPIGVEGVQDQHQHQLSPLDEQYLGVEDDQPQLEMEGGVQHQLLDPVDENLMVGERGQQLQQLAAEEREEREHQLGAEERGKQQLAVEDGLAEGVLPHGAASTVVTNVGLQPGAYAAATATGVLHAAAGASHQPASQREEDQLLTGELGALQELRLDIPREEEQRLTGEKQQEEVISTGGILQNFVVPGSFDEPPVDIPRGPYNSSTVDDLISRNYWGHLENYLSQYFPDGVGHGHLMHAELILLCRSEKLLLILKNQDYAQAQAFLMKEITPLRCSTSSYVKTEKLHADIDHICQCVSQNMAFKNLETNMRNAVHDYMSFYLPTEISFQQSRTNSSYWRFALRIERVPGVVTARCLLCHSVMKMNSIKQGVIHHIGGRRCPKLTPYALQIYELVVAEEEQPKGTKRKFDEVIAAGHGKSEVDKQVKRRTDGIDHAMYIDGWLDEMLTKAGEMRALHQAGVADINPQVNGIIELVAKIRRSVHHIAGGARISQPLHRQTIPGVGEQAHDDVERHNTGLHGELDKEQLEEGANTMLRVAKDVLVNQTDYQANLLLLQAGDEQEEDEE